MLSSNIRKNSLSSDSDSDKFINKTGKLFLTTASTDDVSSPDVTFVAISNPSRSCSKASVKLRTFVFFF
jgi:hypothetical protein